MAHLFGELIDSHLCEFVIGEDAKSFVIHSTAIALLSYPLSKLVNGEMREGKTKRVIWDDVDVETFESFACFAYTYSYTLRKCTAEPRATSKSNKGSGFYGYGEKKDSNDSAFAEKKDSDDSPKESDNDNFDGIERLCDDLYWPKLGKKTNYTRQEFSQELMTKFWNRTYPSPSKYYRLRDMVEGRNFECSHPSNECRRGLIAHSKLYVLAEKYNIHPLRKFTLRKIHAKLADYRGDEIRDEEIVELVEFVYSDDNTSDLQNRLDPLRDLVLHFTVSWAKKLMAYPEFREMFEDGGEYPKNFATAMSCVYLKPYGIL